MNIVHVIGKDDGAYTVEFNPKEGEACIVITADGSIREQHMPSIPGSGMITALFMAYALHRDDWRTEVKDSYIKTVEELKDGIQPTDETMADIIKVIIEMHK